jgi:hypothetical protein
MLGKFIKYRVISSISVPNPTEIEILFQFRDDDGLRDLEYVLDYLMSLEDVIHFEAWRILYSKFSCIQLDPLRKSTKNRMVSIKKYE